MRDTLIDLFDYDLWANNQWLSAVETWPEPARGREVLGHIASAHRTWLTRCMSVEETVPVTGDLRNDFQALHTQWIDLLRICDLNAYASYTTLTGDNFFTMIGEIAQHVVNHGSYHRGQLRGLVEAWGITEFPETDLIRWHRGQREN